MKSFGKKNISTKERKYEKGSSSLLISGFVNVLSRARVKARLQGALGRVKRNISSKGGNDSHQEVKCFYQNIFKKRTSAHSPVAPSPSLKSGHAKDVLKKKKKTKT